MTATSRPSRGAESESMHAARREDGRGEPNDRALLWGRGREGGKAHLRVVWVSCRVHARACVRARDDE